MSFCSNLCRCQLSLWFLIFCGIILIPPFYEAFCFDFLAPFLFSLLTVSGASGTLSTSLLVAIKVTSQLLNMRVLVSPFLSVDSGKVNIKVLRLVLRISGDSGIQFSNTIVLLMHLLLANRRFSCGGSRSIGNIFY